MSGPVDVLAVMDACANREFSAHFKDTANKAAKQRYHQIEEVHSAVTELIRSSEELQFIRQNGCAKAKEEAAIARHNRAIARCKGGAL